MSADTEKEVEPMFRTNTTAKLREFWKPGGGVDWAGLDTYHRGLLPPEHATRDAFAEYREAARTPKKARSGAKKATGGTSTSGSPVQHDPAVRARAVELHVKERLGCGPIAKLVGAHRTTVKKVLIAEGVWDPSRVVPRFGQNGG